MIFPPEVRTLPKIPAVPGAPRPAVFFDRDDTLIQNSTLPESAFASVRGDLVDLDCIRLLPGAADACRRVLNLGYVVLIVTNQGVVARGGAALDEVEAACDRTMELLGGQIAATLACPFHPRANGPAEFCREHAWRKPGPGMLLAAAKLFGLDLARSWMIGDAVRDVQSGIAAGLPQSHCLRVGESMTLPDAMQRVALASVAGHG